MCNSCNKPNCGCSPCQDCNNPIPEQTCVTTCTCTTDQFSADCPCGQVGTNCIIYTGDELLDCEDDPFISRGSTFNSVLSDIWDYVKCSSSPTTDTIDYTGADLKDCGDVITIVPTGTPVTEALESVWDYVKCWETTTEGLVSDRQPVWQGSNSITVGSTQSAPFNDINTALVELAKYHFDDPNTVTITLENGVHNLVESRLLSNNSQSANYLFVGASKNAILVPTSGVILANYGTSISLAILTIKGRIQAVNNSRVNIAGCEIINEANQNISSLVAENNSEITVENSYFTDNSNTSVYANTIATCLDNSRINFEINDSALAVDWFGNKYESVFNIKRNSRISVNHSVNFVFKNPPINNFNPFYINVSDNSDLVINSDNFSQANYLPGVDQVFLNVEKNSRCTIKNTTVVDQCTYPIVCSYHSSIVMQGTLNISSQFPITAINSGDILLGDVQITTGAAAYLVSQNQSKIRVQNSFSGSGASLAAVYSATANSQIMLTDGSTVPIPTVTNCEVGTGLLSPNDLVISGAGAGCVINYL
jgi:hypothetical protein